MFLLLAVASVLAADEPSLWTREAVGLAGWPTGILADARIQARTPLHRSDSMLFRNTYAGAGARLLASPAFVDVGPRISLAPVDVFDLEIQASRAWYLPLKWSLMPFDEIRGKTMEARYERPDDAFGAGAWVVSATPTVKLKVGHVVAFDSLAASWIRFEQPDDIDSKWVYEPYRDQLLAWEDVAFEHQAALAWEFLPGGERPLLWTGATFRQRFALESPDRSWVVGPMVVFRASRSPWVPQIIGQCLFYLEDADRVGDVPNLQALAAWVSDRPFGGD